MRHFLFQHDFRLSSPHRLWQHLDLLTFRWYMGKQVFFVFFYLFANSWHEFGIFPQLSISSRTQTLHFPPSMQVRNTNQRGYRFTFGSCLYRFFFKFHFSSVPVYYCRKSIMTHTLSPRAGKQYQPHAGGCDVTCALIPAACVTSFPCSVAIMVEWLTSARPDINTPSKPSRHLTLCAHSVCLFITPALFIRRREVVSSSAAGQRWRWEKKGDGS